MASCLVLKKIVFGLFSQQSFAKGSRRTTEQYAFCIWALASLEGPAGEQAHEA